MLAATGAAAAQAQDVEVSAKASPDPMGTAEELAFTITVTGAPPDAVQTPSPPVTRGLALTRPMPTRRTEVVFVNGTLRRTVRLTWRYRPVRAGVVRILPVEVVVGSQTVRTADLSVDVVPHRQRLARPPQGTAPHAAAPRPNASPDDASRGPDEGPPLTERDLFIRAVAETTAVYQNEPVTVEYRLYFRPGIQLRHSRLASPWDAAGFWREELDVDARPIPRTVTRNGQRYRTIALKRVAVFPTRPGTLRVDPLQITTEAEVQGGRSGTGGRLGQLFGLRSGYQRVTLASEALALTARPLPPGAPDGFAGAVGRFTMTAQADAPAVQVGEAVRLSVTVEGTGNLAMLEPPAFAQPPDAEVYDPEVDLQIDRTRMQVTGRKTFTYVLVPDAAGTLRLPALALPYFDPDAETYRVARTAPLAVRVTGDEAPAARSTTGTGLPVGDLAGLWTDARWQQTGAVPLHQRAWPVAAAVAPLLLAALALAVRRYRARRAATAAARAARPAAEAHLADADAHFAAGRTDAGFAALERAVLGFVGCRLGVAPAGLTRARLDALLARHGLPRSDRDALRELLDTCDAVRFGPGADAAGASAGAGAGASADADAAEAPAEAARARARKLVAYFDETLPPAAEA